MLVLVSPKSDKLSAKEHSKQTYGDSVKPKPLQVLSVTRVVEEDTFISVSQFFPY